MTPKKLAQFTELVLPTIWNKTFHLIHFNMIKHFVQYIEQILNFGVSVTCPVGDRNEEKDYFLLDSLKVFDK